MAWCGCCAKDEESSLDLVASHQAASRAAPGLGRGLVAVAARLEEPKDAAAVWATSQAHEAIDPLLERASEKKEVGDPPKEAMVRVVPGRRFPVSIPKESRGLGVDINFHDGGTLLLTKVNPGPVQEHNLSHPGLSLAPGDRIVSVNGCERDVQAMLGECKSAPRLELVVQGCTEKAITFARDGRLDLGLEVSNVDCMTLLVTKVLPGGLVAEHNAALPEHDIRREDRIIAINGARAHGAQLIEMLKAQDGEGVGERRLELVVRRIWPDRTK